MLQLNKDDARGTVKHSPSPMRKSGLDALFQPESIALIGATDREGTVGRTILNNLVNGPFKDKVFPVNPARGELLGIKTYPSIRDINQEIDLAVIATPAATVPDLVGQCVCAKAKSVVVISAGFRERGAQGAELEEKIREKMRGSSLRLIGPNCLGIMNPILGLNATFAKDMDAPGKVAFLSQSGALLTAILDWSHQEQVGFSAIVSTGSMLDVGWGDLIEYFGNDPKTESILLYMESVGDARSFVSAAREVSLSKPIIVIKPGRSEAAAKAASSHTGALTGSDEVLDAAFRRCGVLRVQNIADLFYMAEVLGKQPRPKGNRLTILTNAGGPAVLATDSLISNGGELTKLSEETVEELGHILPSHWSHGNPIDILGDADADRYTKAIEIAAKDPNSDGLLVILAPQGMTDASEIARRFKSAAANSDKPLFASWMGSTSVADGTAILNASGIPTFPYPDTAARAFTYVWRYAENLRELYEMPASALEINADISKRVHAQLTDIRESDRTILTEVESKKILSLYGIPTVETQVAHTEDDAVWSSSKIGYPVVLKLFSKTITHKTDVGGVQLNLVDEDAVRRAFRKIEASVAEKVGPEHFAGVTVQPMVRTDGYELILGSSIDPQFGPVILFGSGGQMVEVYRDRALALPPLNTTLAQRLMEQTRIYAALHGIRGRKPVDLVALGALLVRFSHLVLDQPAISELDINPLMASADGLIALDARIVLHDKKTDMKQVPKSAIRPYPSQYTFTWVSDDGGKITLRPIRPEDEALMVKFHESLSNRSVYQRYFYSMSLRSRVRHERLVRVCFGDYDRELVLVAETHNALHSPQGIVGIARISRTHGTSDAEVAIIVCDEWQRRGLGSELLKRVVQIARQEKIRGISAEVLRDNIGMQIVMKRIGFRLKLTDSSNSIRATLDLADGLKPRTSSSLSDSAETS